MSHCGGTDCHGEHPMVPLWEDWQRREFGRLPCADTEPSTGPPATGWAADSQYDGEDFAGPILNY